MAVEDRYWCTQLIKTNGHRTSFCVSCFEGICPTCHAPWLLRVLCAPNLCVLCVHPELPCFLSIRLLMNSCVHDRNALNSFRFRHLRTALIAMEAWGMISCSNVAGLPCFALFAPCDPFSFPPNTNCPLCNSFLLITIRLAGGRGTLPNFEFRVSIFEASNSDMQKWRKEVKITSLSGLGGTERSCPHRKALHI